jgi:predicted phosphodiesterase
VKLAAISDIHGNLYALEAVLADIGRRGVDVIVNLGDILSGSLLPRETAERLIPLGLPTIRGNHERQVLTQPESSMGESDRFASRHITAEQRRWIESLPATLALTDDVYLCHGAPGSDLDYFVDMIENGECLPAPPDLVAERAGSCRASLMFCGHSHVARVLHLPDGRVAVNPGSVGLQAYTDLHPIPHRVQMGSPHARYAVVEGRPGSWTVDLVAVPYEWTAAAALADRNGRPEWGRALRTGFV